MEKLTLTIKETAETLNMCVSMVYRLMNREEHPLPSIRIETKKGKGRGRSKRIVSVDALKSWIQEESDKTMREEE